MSLAAIQWCGIAALVVFGPGARYWSAWKRHAVAAPFAMLVGCALYVGCLQLLAATAGTDCSVMVAGAALCVVLLGAVVRGVCHAARPGGRANGGRPGGRASPWWTWRVETAIGRLGSIWLGMTPRSWWAMLRRAGRRARSMRPLAAGAAQGVLMLLPSVLMGSCACLAAAVMRSRAARRCARVVARRPIGRAPIFLVGHWRSGTSYAHELLDSHPKLSAPTTLECFLPHLAPLVDEERVDRLLPIATPATRPQDNMRMGWRVPNEEEHALMMIGWPSIYERWGFPGLYGRRAELRRRIAWERRCRSAWRRAYTQFLAIVQMRRVLRSWPGKSMRRKSLRQRLDVRLVLKSPTHGFRIAELARMFPEAKFVVVHRPWRAVRPSTEHFWASVGRSQAVWTAGADPAEDFVAADHRLHDRRLARALRAMRAEVGPAALRQRVRFVEFDALKGDVGSAAWTAQISDLLAWLGLAGDVPIEMRAHALSRCGYRQNVYSRPHAVPSRDDLAAAPAARPSAS